ncbi:MAG TPA: S41 family peptidase [Thermoanaerobaculia bacterium]|nr:S41 family peptidase [Thermoanaerobaculia bacterium]
MTLLAPLLALALLAEPPAAPPTPSPPPPSLSWGWFSEPEGAYVCGGKGDPVSPEGATVEVRSRPAAPAGSGGRGASFDATPYRRRQLTVSADLRTRSVSGAALLFLRIEKDGVTLGNDVSFQNALSGDTDWTPRSASLRVPPGATRIFFGVVLFGSGEVSARRLRVEGSDRPRPDGPPSVSPEIVLDAAIAIVRSNALRRDAVDWAKAEPEICSLAGGAEEPSDVYPAIALLLSKLGDRHSRLLTPRQFSDMNSAGAANPPVEVRSLPGHVGLVRVPGYWGNDLAAMERFATQAHDALIEIRKEARCGWVVDLRGNTGGNMWPMVAALAPFLGEETLGCFEGGADPEQAWNARMASENPPPIVLEALQSARVAVLTGPGTASSGEAITTAFRGRPGTKSFGEPTAGLSTANRPFPLPDGGAILLTVSVMADRTGRWYGGPIEPDVRIEVPPGTTEDLALEAAVRWLRESPGCDVPK